jgi:hypothetical protein
MKFTKKENEILGEIYRRLNFFHNGDLNTDLLLLTLPSNAKVLSKYKLIKSATTETTRALNWYKLTDKGKKFFSNYILKNKMTKEQNLELFKGNYIKKFDKKLLESL